MVEELLPGTVAGLAEVNVNKRVVLRLYRFLNKSHAGYFRSAAAFSSVAAGTGTNNVIPGRFAAHSARNDMVERQLSGRETFATVLAAALVAGKDITTVKLDIGTRQTVVK